MTCSPVYINFCEIQHISKTVTVSEVCTNKIYMMYILWSYVGAFYRLHQESQFMRVPVYKSSLVALLEMRPLLVLVAPSGVLLRVGVPGLEAPSGGSSRAGVCGRGVWGQRGHRGS